MAIQSFLGERHSLRCALALLVSFRILTTGLFHFSIFCGGKALSERVKDIMLSIIKVAKRSERGLRGEVFA